VRRTFLAAIANLVILAVPSLASAADPPPGVRRLPYDARADVAVTVIGAMAIVTAESLKGVIAPSCRWCYRNPDGTDRLNFVDSRARNVLKWSNVKTADSVSNVTAFVLTPAAAYGLTALAASKDHALHGFPVDALIITEATILALDFNQLAKLALARERPFVHYLATEERARRGLNDAENDDDNVSFFSGHTAATFALASSSGTVASMRGYAYAPAVWSVGLSLAAFTGYLRIAGDRHFFTDVLVGAISGTLIGVGVPLIFHSPHPTTNGATPPSASSPLMMSGTW
jgi:membrane-associated phospholipid phosphatase